MRAHVLPRSSRSRPRCQYARARPINAAWHFLPWTLSDVAVPWKNPWSFSAPIVVYSPPGKFRRGGETTAYTQPLKMPKIPSLFVKLCASTRGPLPPPPSNRSCVLRANVAHWVQLDHLFPAPHAACRAYRRGLSTCVQASRAGGLMNTHDAANYLLFALFRLTTAAPEGCRHIGRCVSELKNC